MPFNLLLFPLLSGFIFVTFWNRTKIRAARYQGYRLILYSSIWGAIFLLLSILLLRLPYLGPLADRMMEILFSPFYSQYGGFGLTFLSFFIGSVSWIPLNIFIFRKEREYAQAVKIFGSRLERILLAAIQNNSMLSVTLSSRKVYVGYVIEDINPEKDRSFLTLFPILSGYRHKDSLGVTFTTNYIEVYNELMEDPDSKEGRKRIIRAYDFRICIKASDIISISGFDSSIYSCFTEKGFLAEEDT